MVKLGTWQVSANIQDDPHWEGKRASSSLWADSEGLWAASVRHGRLQKVWSCWLKTWLWGADHRGVCVQVVCCTLNVYCKYITVLKTSLKGVLFLWDVIWFMHCCSMTMRFPVPWDALIKVCRWSCLTSLRIHNHHPALETLTHRGWRGTAARTWAQGSSTSRHWIHLRIWMHFSAGYVNLPVILIASTFYSNHCTSSQEPTALSSPWDKVLFRSTKTFI